MSELEITLIIVCTCIILMSVVTGTIIEIVLNHKLEERTKAVHYYKWHNLYRKIRDIIDNVEYTDSEKCSQIKGYLRYDVG